MRNVATAEAATRLVGSDRVLAVLKELAGYADGATLDELTKAVGGPKPTIHRALGSLRRAAFAEQGPDGRYRLGDEYLRLAFDFHEVRPDHVRVRPALETLASRFGETTHYAVLDGREIVYRAKVDPPTGAVRLTSTVGGRNPAHATAVGKLLLARELTSLAEVRAWIGRTPLPARTANTLCTAPRLHRELAKVREQGYAVDDEENEPGINCLALPVHALSSAAPSGGVSVSALAYRTPLRALVGRVAEVREALGPLGESR
jgi:DNA-binding IclR family transcriptional regulator